MTSASGIPTLACVVILMNEERHLQDCRRLSIGSTRIGKLVRRVVNVRQIWPEEGGGRKMEIGAMPVSLLGLVFKLPLSWKTFNLLAGHGE